MKLPLLNSSITLNQIEALVRPFLQEEIEEIIGGMNMDKAPGPDGFPGFFHENIWHIIK